VFFAYLAYEYLTHMRELNKS